MGKFDENRERTLTQDQFVRRLAGSMGESNEVTLKWVQGIRRELISCLLDGLSVKLVELGTFEPRRRVARRNPHNPILGGQECICKEKTVAHLTPSKWLNTMLTRAYESREGLAK